MAEHSPHARQDRGRGGVRLTSPAAYDQWFDTGGAAMRSPSSRRLSIGIEAPGDLIADLEAALDAAASGPAPEAASEEAGR